MKNENQNILELWKRLPKGCFTLQGVIFPKANMVIQDRKQEFAKSALKTIREIQSTGVDTLAKIADCLNKRGEKTARGGTWTATAVKRVLACAA